MVFLIPVCKGDTLYVKIISFRTNTRKHYTLDCTNDEMDNALRSRIIQAIYFDKETVTTIYYVHIENSSCLSSEPTCFSESLHQNLNGFCWIKLYPDN